MRLPLRLWTRTLAQLGLQWIATPPLCDRRSGDCTSHSRASSRGASRQRKLRVESLESRAMLTAVEEISLSVGSWEYTEGDTTQFTVHFSPATDEAVALDYELVGDSTATGTISVASGENSAPADFLLPQDGTPEADYTLELRITAINGTPLDPPLSVSTTVHDDDYAAQMALAWSGGAGSLTTFSDIVSVSNVGGSWVGSGEDDQGHAFAFTATLPEISGTSLIDLVIDGLPSDYGHWLGAGGPDPLTRPWTGDFDMHSEDSLFDGAWGFIFDNSSSGGGGGGGGDASLSVAFAEGDEGNEGDEIALDLTPSGGSGSPVGYDIDWGDNTSDHYGVGVTPVHVYADNDTYTVIVLATWEDDETAEASATITIANVAPTAADDSGETTADEPFTTINVFDNDTDPGADDVLTIVSFDTTGTFGLVTYNDDGTFSYDPNGAFDYLAGDETATDAFTYTIADDDDPNGISSTTVTVLVYPPTYSGPQLSITAESADYAEGSAASFLIALAQSIDDDLVLAYEISATGVIGIEWAPISGAITIPVGETTGSLTIDIPDDLLQTGDFTLHVSLVSANGALLENASGANTAVHDNDLPLACGIDATILFSVADSSEFEEDESGAAGQIGFEVSIDEALEYDLSFTYAVIDGDALAGVDFDETGGTAVIPAGETSTVIWVALVNDTISEGFEAFTIEVQEDGTCIPPESATGTILDVDAGGEDDPIGDIELLDAAEVSEPATIAVEDATYAQFILTYFNPSSSDATIDWYTDSDNDSLSATPDDDYVSAQGTLVLPPTEGPVSISLVIPIAYDDVTDEADEVFKVFLQNPSGVAIKDGRGVAQAVIKDRGASGDTKATIVAVTPTAKELGLGKQRGQVTVSRTGSTAGDMLVTFTLAGSAVLNTDYYFAKMDGISFGQGLEDRVVIPDGASSVSFFVVPIQDANPTEGSEHVVITLDPGPLTGSPASATVTIEDAGNDVAISTSSNNSKEGDSPTRTFTISRGTLSDAPLTVDIARSGSAAIQADYYVVAPRARGVGFYSYFPSSVTILAGQMTADITLQIIDDAEVENPDETITVSIAQGTGYSISAGAGSATATIKDDDAKATLSITPAVAQVNEWGNASVGLTVSRTGSTEFGLPVALAVSGDAIESLDYDLFVVRGGAEQSVRDRSIEFQPGESSVALLIRPRPDTLIEPATDSVGIGEKVIVTLQGSDRADVSSDASSATVTIVDDDHPNSDWEVIRWPAPRDDVFTDWQLRAVSGGRGVPQRWVFERQRLVFEWQKTTFEQETTLANEDRNITIASSISFSQSRTYNIGGSLNATVEPRDGLQFGGTISGALENQYTIQFGAETSETIALPAGAKLRQAGAVLRVSKLTQLAPASGPSDDTPPPAGSPGSSAVSSQFNSQFTFLNWIGSTVGVDFVYVTGSQWVFRKNPSP